MRSVRGQTSLERSAFSMPPHMNEPILTVAAERTSQLLPNHRFYDLMSRHNNTILLNNTPYVIVMLERKSCTKETYRRTKETFTTCFELQGLSALLDMHMMIITSIEEDCSARGSIPVTTKVPTRPKQEGTSDTNMWKGHHQTTTGERCNLRLLFQKDCNTTGSCKTRFWHGPRARALPFSVEEQQLKLNPALNMKPYHRNHN